MPCSCPRGQPLAAVANQNPLSDCIFARRHRQLYSEMPLGTLRPLVTGWQLVGGLVGWLAGSLAGWLLGWLAGWLAGWLPALLVGLFVGWPTGQRHLTCRGASPLADCMKPYHHYHYNCDHDHDYDYDCNYSYYYYYYYYYYY